MRSDDTVLGCLPSRTLETIFVSILAQSSVFNLQWFVLSFSKLHLQRPRSAGLPLVASSTTNLLPSRFTFSTLSQRRIIQRFSNLDVIADYLLFVDNSLLDQAFYNPGKGKGIRLNSGVGKTLWFYQIQKRVHSFCKRDGKTAWFELRWRPPAGQEEPPGIETRWTWSILDSLAGRLRSGPGQHSKGGWGERGGHGVGSKIIPRVHFVFLLANHSAVALSDIKVTLDWKTDNSLFTAYCHGVIKSCSPNCTLPFTATRLPYLSWPTCDQLWQPLTG